MAITHKSLARVSIFATTWPFKYTTFVANLPSSLRLLSFQLNTSGAVAPVLFRIYNLFTALPCRLKIRCVTQPYSHGATFLRPGSQKASRLCIFCLCTGRVRIRRTDAAVCLSRLSPFGIRRRETHRPTHRPTPS